MDFSISRSLRNAAPLFTVLLVSASLLWWYGLRGWYAHDEGLLGQSALRVMQGGIPHRDFSDPYTGGLSLLHAGVFRLFGVRLDVLRRFFDLVALGWSSVVFVLARRWLPPWGAALAAICALVWSVPVYPAAVPSWYVLFLVTTALAVVVRDEGRGRAGPLVVAGIFLGLAVLVKVTALYAVAGFCIAFGRLRQLDEDRRHASLELLCGAGVFVFGVILLTDPSSSSRVLVHITVPAVVLVAVVILEELRVMRANGLGWDSVLRRRVTFLTLGIGIPLVPFGIWLAVHGGLKPLLDSLATVAGQRTAFAHFLPPTAISALLAFPLLLVLLGFTARVIRPPLLGALLGVILVASWQRGDIQRLVWESVRGLLPLGSTILALLWARRAIPGQTERFDHVFVALTCATLAVGQFPFAAPIYYLYLAPLVVLALVTVMPDQHQRPTHVIMVAMALTAFAVVQVLPLNRGYVRRPISALGMLPGSRGGLLVQEEDARVYGQLLNLIASIRDTLPMWSGPDAPEVAFLAGRDDRNSIFFSFLERPASEQGSLGERLLREGVRTVVIQTEPAFSPPLSKTDLEGLTRRYPESRTIGTFEVRWRRAAP